MMRRSLAHLPRVSAWDWFAAELRSPGTRHTIIMLAGNLSRFILSFAASVIIARSIGLTDYGLLALVSTILTVVDTVGDLGLTNAAVRTLSRAQNADPERVRRITYGYFSLAFIANGVAAVVGIVFAEPIARLILGRPDAAPYIRVALLGLLPTAGTGFVTTMLQARRRFGSLAVVQTLTTFTYLISIVLLTITGHLGVMTIVLVGVVNPLAGFVIGLRFLPTGVISPAQTLTQPARRTWSELTAFSKWLWASTLLLLLTTRLDLFMLSHWAPAAAVGVYALAFSLSMKMDIINQTRLTVLLPSVSSLYRRSQMRTFVAHNLARSIPLAAVFAVAIPFFDSFIVAVYGPAFADAAPVLTILTFVVIVDLVTTPLTLLGYPLNQPWALTASEAMQIVTLALAGWLLIPALGPIGAALARLSSKVIGAVFIFVVLAARLRKMSEAALSKSAPGD